MFLNGQAILTPGPHGEEVSDDSFMLLFNAHDEDRAFKLPRRRWERVGSSSSAPPTRPRRRVAPSTTRRRSRRDRALDHDPERTD